MGSEGFAAPLIQSARHRVGMTQQELARRAGTSQAAISAYESGLRSPSVDTLCRIVDAAGFEVRMRLAEPDTHEAARERAEALLPADQVAAHYRRQADRLAVHESRA